VTRALKADKGRCRNWGKGGLGPGWLKKSADFSKYRQQAHIHSHRKRITGIEEGSGKWGETSAVNRVLHRAWERTSNLKGLAWVKVMRLTNHMRRIEGEGEEKTELVALSKNTTN